MLRTVKIASYLIACVIACGTTPPALAKDDGKSQKSSSSSTKTTSDSKKSSDKSNSTKARKDSERSSSREARAEIKQKQKEVAELQKKLEKAEKREARATEAKQVDEKRSNRYSSSDKAKSTKRVDASNKDGGEKSKEGSRASQKSEAVQVARPDDKAKNRTEKQSPPDKPTTQSTPNTGVSSKDVQTQVAPRTVPKDLTRAERTELKQIEGKVAKLEKEVAKTTKRELTEKRAELANARKELAQVQQGAQKSKTPPSNGVAVSQSSAPAFTPQPSKFSGKSSISDVLRSSDDKQWVASLTRAQRQPLDLYSGEQLKEIKNSGQWDAFKKQINSTISSPSTQTANSTPSTGLPGNNITQIATIGTSRNLDRAQLALGAAGLTPGVGVVPDVINGAVSVARGDLKGATQDFVAAIPAAGAPIGAARIAKRVDGLIPSATNYRSVFFEANPMAPRELQVHHALPQKYERLMSQNEINIHDGKYLRGISASDHLKVTADWALWERGLGREPSAEDVINKMKKVDEQFRTSFWK